MAVIYLDGNDFGKKQRNLDIPALKTFDFEKTYFQRKWLASLMQDVVSNKNGDWKTAVSFYLKVVDKGTSVDITRPYEAKPYIAPPKKNKDSAKVAVDTSKLVTADPTEQYAIHQIADCYRLNSDYVKIINVRLPNKNLFSFLFSL